MVQDAGGIGGDSFLEGTLYDLNIAEHEYILYILFKIPTNSKYIGMGWACTQFHLK